MYIAFLVRLELATTAATASTGIVVITDARRVAALGTVTTGTLAAALFLFLGAGRLAMRVLFLGMVGLVGRRSDNHRGGWRLWSRSRRFGFNLGRLLRCRCWRSGSFRRFAGGLGSDASFFLGLALGFGLDGCQTGILCRTQLIGFALAFGFQINRIALDVGLLLAHFDVDRLAAGYPQGADRLALEGDLARLPGGLPAMGVLEVSQQCLLLLIAHALICAGLGQTGFLHLL